MKNILFENIKLSKHSKVVNFMIIIDGFECFCRVRNYKSSAENFKIMLLLTPNKFPAML